MTKVRNTIFQSGRGRAGPQRAGSQSTGLQDTGLAALASVVLKRAAACLAGLVTLMPTPQPRLVLVRVSTPGRRMPGARCPRC